MVASSLFSITTPVPEQIVKVSDSEGFAVRGLSPVQVGALYRRHADELAPILQQVVAGSQMTGSAQQADIEPLVRLLLGESPTLMAELIVLGSGGDPDDVTLVTITDPGSREPVTLRSFEAALLIAKRLPFPVQADALDKIAALTFTADMSLQRLLGLAALLLTKADTV